MKALNESKKIKKPNGDTRKKVGQVAFRDIKKYQKMGNTLIFAKRPFAKFVRNLLLEYKDQVKVSKNVCNIIQYVIEDYIVHFLTDANAAAIHAGRVKMMIQDVNFVRIQRDGGNAFVEQKVQTKLTPKHQMFDTENMANDDAVRDAAVVSADSRN